MHRSTDAQEKIHILDKWYWLHCWQIASVSSVAYGAFVYHKSVYAQLLLNIRGKSAKCAYFLIKWIIPYYYEKLIRMFLQ